MNQEFDVPLCLALGNQKVGRVWTFSLPSLVTCPGASPWCREHCYARRLERFRTNCRQAYLRNLTLSQEPDHLVNKVLASLPEDAKHMRIHVGGDFYSAAYIRAWITICEARPHTRFGAYTRSWVVPELLPSLEQLRALPNVELFASTDPDMSLPPEGWRIAFIADDPRAKGLVCPHQQGLLPSCLTCGYCLRSRPGNVIFNVH
jgi:hypothetical protein